MIYIIEGCDGSGKTTLANYISKRTGYPIIHRSKPETEEERANMYQSYMDDIEAGTDVIWDRCFYSEMVYGPIMRDQSYIDKEQMYKFEEALAKEGAMIIYCTGPDYLLYENATKRGEEYITSIEQIAAISKAYQDLFMGMGHYIPVTIHYPRKYIHD